MIEYDIIIKNEKDKLIAKDHCPYPLVISLENTFLSEKIEEALRKFGYDPNEESPEITLKFKILWQS